MNFITFFIPDLDCLRTQWQSCTKSKIKRSFHHWMMFSWVVIANAYSMLIVYLISKRYHLQYCVWSQDHNLNCLATRWQSCRQSHSSHSVLIYVNDLRHFRFFVMQRTLLAAMSLSKSGCKVSKSDWVIKEANFQTFWNISSYSPKKSIHIHIYP